MRVGIIDLGTNSVRFDVNQIGPGNRVRKLHREKLMVRLGQNLFVDGKLDPAAMRRTLQAFSSFQRTASELQVGKIVAFGTAALREAGDSDRLLNTIRKRTGIDVRVISGQEEAKLIAKGIINNEKGAATKGRYGLIDIGGGSTEISICRGKEVLYGESFPLGTARLQQVFLKSSPPPAAKKGELSATEQLRRYIRSIILPKLISEEWPKVNRIVGSSGTIRALSRLAKKSKGKNKGIDLKDLKKLVKQMSAMTTTQLLGMPGMEARRVDMILAGAILLEECMTLLGAKKTLSSDFSLRDGILEEEMRIYRQHEVSNIPFHLADLYARAQKFRSGGLDEEGHLKQTVELAENLFDRLRPLHRLNPKWRHYLTAASILHDVGQAISPTRHGIHSYYIVKNADFPSMEKWEAEFVGQLCLYHQDGKVDQKGLPFAKEDKQAFMKLLAILRVADALDRSHKRLLKVRDVKIDRKGVHILVGARNGIDLELLRVEQKKILFEQIFKRPLDVSRI